MPRDAGRRPNVVVLITDDTDFPNIGCYGGRVPTPSIDRVAREGVRFDGVYCSASVCTPSRYTYLTGHYAGRCPDRHFLAQCPTDGPYSIAWNVVLNEEMPSVGSVLRDAGYRTGYAGKWHCGRPAGEFVDVTFEEDEDPAAPGVDERLRRHQTALCDEVRRTGGFDYAASVVWGNNEQFPLKALQYHNLEWITKGALEFLDGCDASKPFLLYVAATAFHGPTHHASYDRDPLSTQGGRLDAPVDAHPPRSEMKPRLEAAGLPYNHQTVGMTWIDDQLSAITKKLEAMGVLDETLLVYKSDHNTEPGKGTCYEGGIHIPWVMRYPKRIAAGTTTDAMVMNTDFAPTVFELCGASPPTEMPLDGTSLWPLIAGETSSVREDVFLEMGWARAVRTAKYKYIALRYPRRVIDEMESGARAEAPNHIDRRLQGQMCIAAEQYPGYFDGDELYDVEADPREQRNLAFDPAHAEVLADMRRRLSAYTSTFAHPFDLDDVAFLRSDRFRRLADETRKIGTAHIPWWTARRAGRE